MWTVIFGAGGKGLRRMVHVMQDTGSIVLNAATVPRVRPCPDNGWLGRPKGTLRHFLLVQLADGQVEYAKEVWVHVQVGSAAYIMYSQV